MAESTLMAHVIAQTQANISLLQTHGYLDPVQAANMQAQLAVASVSGGNVRSAGFPAPTREVHVVVASAPPPFQPPTVQAKTLWAYNENGSDPKDLSFSAGEIIEIIEETNADWWTGRIRNREGLFPSNYVEILPQGPPPATTGKAYRPFMAAHHGSDVPPAEGERNSVGLMQDSGQDKKKSKYGKLGNTMAHSAAGGVGFGAGSAIGGGLVRAIF